MAGDVLRMDNCTMNFVINNCGENRHLRQILHYRSSIAEMESRHIHISYKRLFDLFHCLFMVMPYVIEGKMEQLPNGELT
jgi:hypothetical protein